tara:strand:+ start:325 stop:507 length:183 start_codon:yes stop_codon:yes gene_type:complete
MAQREAQWERMFPDEKKLEDPGLGVNPHPVEPSPFPQLGEGFFIGRRDSEWEDVSGVRIR